MADIRLRDVSTFLLDGIGDPAPAYLWVSDSQQRHDAYLMDLAHQILHGDAPEDFAGRRMLEFDVAKLLGKLAEYEDPDAFVETVVGELEDSGVVFGVRGIERLLDSAAGRVFLDGILDATRDGRVGCLLALTGSRGLERLKAEAPRLLGLSVVLMLDAKPQHSLDLRSLVVPEAPSDPGECGWYVAVRCRLIEPAPALASLAAGSTSVNVGGVGAFDDERVDRLHLVESDIGIAAIMVGISAAAAGPAERELAADIALDAARTAVWRPLRPDEELAVVRQVHYG